MDPDPSYLLSILLTENIDALVFVYLGILVLLLYFSSVISGSEVAFFSFKHHEIEELEESKSPTDAAIAKLLKRPQKLLATILISNNFVNIAIVILAEYLIRRVFDFKDSPLLQMLISIVGITFILLLFGEVIPKVYASGDKFRFARRHAAVFLFLNKTLTVFSQPLLWMSRGIEKLSSHKASKETITVDNLSQALEMTTADPDSEQDKRMLEGIISFGKTDAKAVMTPRIDVISLSTDMSFAQIREIITRNGFSRIPVYGDNPDNIIGVLNIKDLLPFLDQEEFDWTGVIRKPFFVPGNRKIDDILLDFQQMKTHLAIVVDEYGGTLGVITMDDIIEEIVGEIADEFDDEDIVYSRIDDTHYIFEGKTSLKDMYRILDVEDEELFEKSKGEADSLAGFVLEIAGAFPKKGEQIRFGPYVFTVESIDRKRIKQIKISILPEEPEK